MRNVVRGLVQRHGPQSAKQRLWDAEFASGHWNCLDNTGDESVHQYIENYAKNGSILDLGCGPGTTSLELNPAKYVSYTGVDISEVAVVKARQRAQETGRSDRNEYCQADIVTYMPPRKYDVILFGDSIYYVPTRRVASIIGRYSPYLKDSGVFVARMFDISGRRRHILDSIESSFVTVERHLNHQTGVCVIVFKPTAAATRTIPL